MPEAQTVGVIHRTTAPYRPAIAMHPDYVEIAGPARDTFIEDARAFVDHRQDHALDDFLLTDRPAVDAEPRRSLEDCLFDLRIGERRARTGLVAEVPLPGLLAVMPGFAQCVLDERLLAPSFPNAPPDIEPGEIHHRTRAHRESEPGDRGIDLLRQCTFEQQPFGLDRPAVEHAVADKPVT